MDEFWRTVRDESFTVPVLIGAFLISIVIGITTYNIRADIMDARMAEAGLEQVTVPGYAYPVWQKVVE